MFNVGDRVRASEKFLTRSYECRCEFCSKLRNGETLEITRIVGEDIFVENDDIAYHMSSLELVPHDLKSPDWKL